MDVLTSALLALVVTAALEPPLIWWLTRRAMLDVPGERSNHSVPTPRGGGIAVMAGLVVGIVFTADPVVIGLLGGILIAAVVGLLEDVCGLRIASRLLLTAIAAIALLAVLALGELPPGLYGGALLVVAVPWTLAVVNAMNFMDGINGISAATGVVGGVAYSLLGYATDNDSLTVLGLVVAAAMLGFAPYNVPVARVFLGDVGSYGLGAAFAAMSLLAVAGGLPLEAAVAPLALYLADTGNTIVRRVRDGEPWQLPHKRHTYQQLVALGPSQVAVGAAVGILTMVCAALGAVSLFGSVLARTSAVVMLLIVLVAYLASPRLLPSREAAC